jgi:hypothetical protein
VRVAELVIFIAAAHVFLVARESLYRRAREVFVIVLPLGALLEELLVLALASQDNPVLRRNIELINRTINVNFLS